MDCKKRVFYLSEHFYKILRNSFISPQIRNVSTTDLPKIPDCKYAPSVYKAVDYENFKSTYTSRVSPSIKQLYKKPLLIHEGRAQWVWDNNGERYLDMYGGIATISVGHSHPQIVGAIVRQASILGHISPSYMHYSQLEYIEKLTSKFPESLRVVYLTNSGSEANELAFLMAKIYTGAHNIISFRNSYHGGTFAAAAATGLSTWKYPLSQASEFIQAMNPDVYKGHWGGSRCRDCIVPPAGRKCSCKQGECYASEKYLLEFKDLFDHNLSKVKPVAGFIAESIQGFGGVVQYPRNLLKDIYGFVRQKGGLCIADEVQTGFGRTGEHFWGFEGHGICPDIVTMAKGIGNGFPLGAVVTTPEIANALNTACHFNTFGGNALACVVGETVLDIIEEEKLQENAHIVGTYLLEKLSTLIVEYPDLVGDIRGKGLMIGIELIENQETKKPLALQHICDIFEDVKDMRLLIGKGGLHSNVIRIKPPMCVTKEDADFTVEVIRTALQKHRERHLKDKEFVFLGST